MLTNKNKVKTKGNVQGALGKDGLAPSVRMSVCYKWKAALYFHLRREAVHFHDI